MVARFPMDVAAKLNDKNTRRTRTSSPGVPVFLSSMFLSRCCCWIRSKTFGAAVAFAEVECGRNLSDGTSRMRNKSMPARGKRPAKWNVHSPPRDRCRSARRVPVHVDGTSVMNNSAKAGLWLLGAIVSLPVGALTAFYSIAIFGWLIFGRDFYQIAWLIQMLGVPVGALVAAAFGAQTASTRPRVFAATFVPLSASFLILEVAQYHLRRIEQSRLFTVNITADSPALNALKPPGRANGRRFTGTVTTDEEVHPIKGTIPTTANYRAVRMQFHIELTDGKKDEWYAIKITAGDKIVNEILTDFGVTGDAWTRGIGWWNRTDGSFAVKRRE